MSILGYTGYTVYPIFRYTLGIRLSMSESLENRRGIRVFGDGGEDDICEGKWTKVGWYDHYMIIMIQ